MRWLALAEGPRSRPARRPDLAPAPVRQLDRSASCSPGDEHRHVLALPTGRRCSSSRAVTQPCDPKLILPKLNGSAVGHRRGCRCCPSPGSLFVTVTVSVGTRRRRSNRRRPWPGSSPDRTRRRPCRRLGVGRSRCVAVNPTTGATVNATGALVPCLTDPVRLRRAHRPGTVAQSVHRRRTTWSRCGVASACTNAPVQFGPAYTRTVTVALSPAALPALPLKVALRPSARSPPGWSPVTAGAVESASDCGGRDVARGYRVPCAFRART